MYNFNEIKEQFDKVVEGLGIPGPLNTQPLFDKWVEAKADFINSWGGELRWKYPERVTFSLAPKEKEAKIDEFITWLDFHKYPQDMINFVDYNREGIFDNKVVTKQDYIPTGMKLGRAFRYFISDAERLKHAQNELSYLIQNDKITGDLYFSVHPLDFLSVSESTYHMHTCHSLNGDYCSGNFEYMVDPSTVICYIAGAENAELPNFPTDVPWNAKRWRVLLHFSDDRDTLFVSKQYPFSCNEFFNFLLDEKVLINAFTFGANFTFGGWSNEYINSVTKADGSLYHLGDRHILLGNEILSLYNVLDLHRPAHYFCDIINAKDFKAWYMGKYTPKSNRHTTVGAEATCVRCGKEPISRSDLPVCDACATALDCLDDALVTCSCCGDAFESAQGLYTYSLRLVCPRCMETKTVACKNCGEVFLKEDLDIDGLCEECADLNFQ